MSSTELAQMRREPRTINQQARAYLDKAKASVARSDAALLEAADLIESALRADSALTLTAAGEYVGRSETWVRALLAWADSHEEGEPLFAADTTARLARGTKQGLRELPEETLVEIMEEDELWDRVRGARFLTRRWSEQGADREELSPADHFRRYGLSRLNGWSLEYDWEQKLSPEEREELAGELKAALSKLTATVEKMAEGLPA